MASASSKRSLDTDYITLRKVFAKQSDNSQVPTDYVLASAGDGRTYWAPPSTLGGLPTFTEVQFDEQRSIANKDLRLLQISASNGIGLSTAVSSVVNSLQLYGKNFSYIDVSGVSSLYAFSNFLLNNTFLFAPSGFVSSATNPSYNTILLTSLRDAEALSTNIISYQSLKIISTLTSPGDTSPFAGNMIWSKTNSSAFPVFAGYQDFRFRTQAIPPILGIELSSYSAQNFLGVSTAVATSFLSTLSSISSLYTQKDVFSTGIISLSTSVFVQYSTNVSTTYGVSNYTQITYNQKFGDTMARATIIQLNDQFGILNTGVSTISSFKTPVYVMVSTNQAFIDSYSTPQTLSTSTFFDFTAGSIFDFTVNGMLVVSTQLSTLSTSIGSNITTFSNGFQPQIPPFTVSTASTFMNLGTLGYISSASLQSSVIHLGSWDYISTPALVSSFSTYILGFPSSVGSYFTSTTKGLNDAMQIVSSLTLQSSIVSTTRGITLEAAFTYISTLQYNESIESTTKGIIGYAGSFGYLSTQSLNSSLQSTVKGLSTSLYVTSSQSVSTLQSTIDSISFVTMPVLQAQIESLSGYVNATNLASTSASFLNLTRQFTSSIPIPTNFTAQPTTMIPLFGGPKYPQFDTYTAVDYMGSNYYFSSLQFAALGGFGEVLQNARFVTIEYSPVIFFSPYTEIPEITEVFLPTVSTGVQIGSDFLHKTLFREKFLPAFFNPPYTNDGASNIYSKKILIQLDRSSFLTATTNGFAIAHIFENLVNTTDACNVYYRFEDVVRLYSPASNSLFISIYN